MKNPISSDQVGRVSMLKPLLWMMMAFFVAASPSMASEKDKQPAPPSAQVDVTLVSPVPMNGFMPGDLIQIQVQVTNVNNTGGAFRADILDFPMLDNPEKTAEHDYPEPLHFGRNVILREATFSHGVFMRTVVVDDCRHCEGKRAVDEDMDREFAKGSNAYTWVIDQRFRNGDLDFSDVATLNLTVEYIVNTNINGTRKVADVGPQEYQLFVDFSEPSGYQFGTRWVSVPIDLDGYESPGGIRSYTTVIAPEGLQAGEPFLVEHGLIGYNAEAQATYDFRLNEGFTSFYANSFYQGIFSMDVPMHQSGSPLIYSSLSTSFGKLSGYHPMEPKSTDEVNGPHGGPFSLSYMPENEEYRVKSIDGNCGYSSEVNSCAPTPIDFFTGMVVRLFMQGVASLEMAGSNAVLSGGVTITHNPICDYGVNSLNCKSASDGVSVAPEVLQVYEEIPIAPYTFTKVVSDPCFESGESGNFKIEISGADFRKTSSIWFVSDKVPTAVSPTDIFYNFGKSTPNNNGKEYGLISKEPGGGFQYMFNNIAYFNYYYGLGQTKQAESVETQPTGIDHNWYETIHFELPFDVAGNAAPGLHTNTAIFNFFTLPFDNNWYLGKVADHEIQISNNAFDEIDAETLQSFVNMIDLFFDIPGKVMEQTADFTVGCSVVSGYKFHDQNANGSRDANEPGLEGWEITIQGSEGTYKAMTDASGYYEFPHVKAGNYQVRETQKQGWVQSFPAGEGFYNVSVSRAITSARADFGNYQTARVFGYKYVDLNGSGTFDQGESGLEGVRIYLMDLGGNLVAETFSAADGSFSFEGLVPGNYALYEEIPQGMYQSQPGAGTGGFYSLHLTSGDHLGPKNFGNYFLTSLEGDVYYTNAVPPKGVPDAVASDRFPAPGVPVSGVRTGPAPLKPGSGDPMVLPGLTNFTVVTDANGHFHVDGLLPGMYTISVAPPEFVTVVTPNPLTEVLVSGGYVLLEFGLYYDELAAPEITKSSITGSVFADANGDGQWQFPSEAGVPGRAVSLSGTSKRGATITRSTSTGPDGSYTFAELPEGRYTVAVQSVVGASVGAPLSASHVVALGENQAIGRASSGAPGGSGWLQSATAGQDMTFGSLVLAVDTDMNGIADTRMDFSGLATFVLGGITGQTVRPFAMTSLQMDGDNLQGDPIIAVTPGLIEALGVIEGSGPQVSRGMESGLVISAGGDFFYTSDAIPFAGSADRWPIRNTTAVFNALTVGTPVNLRDVEGTVIAHIVYAEHTPTFGVDFAAERVDFGDAPITYGTLRATPADPFVVTTGGIVYPGNGARHLMPWTGAPALMLGSAVTADADGQPGANADGDSDEGVVLPAAVAPNATFKGTVSVTGAGQLNVWVDTDRNGTFDAAEHQVVGLAVETGNVEIDLTSGSAGNGPMMVRVRLSSTASGATGLALDGEVEDYAVTVDASMAGGGGGLPTSDDGDEAVPTTFALYQNYPNPFNPTTVIPYDLASTSRVRITVYDVTGRPVASLLDAQQNAGRHQVAFNAEGLPSGVYMVRLEAGGQVMVRKLTLLK